MSSPSATRLRPAPNFPIILDQGVEVLGARQLALNEVWGKGKPVVLNFWAAECLPCREELPNFQDLSRTLAPGQWTMLGIDVGPYVGLGSHDDGKALLHRLKITFPAGTTPEEDTVTVYRIIGMPTTVFITSDGRIFKIHVGALKPERMTELVHGLLQASGIK